MDTKIVLSNFDTVQPDLVAIEVLKVKDPSSDEVIYTSQLIVVVDKILQKMFYLPTDVWDTTAYEACRKTLQGAMRLFDEIGSDVPVIDIESGKLLDTINLNTAFPSWRDIDADADTVKAPDDVVLH